MAINANGNIIDHVIFNNTAIDKIYYQDASYTKSLYWARPFKWETINSLGTIVTNGVTVGNRTFDLNNSLYNKGRDNNYFYYGDILRSISHITVGGYYLNDIYNYWDIGEKRSVSNPVIAVTNRLPNGNSTLANIPSPSIYTTSFSGSASTWTVPSNSSDTVKMSFSINTQPVSWHNEQKTTIEVYNGITGLVKRENVKTTFSNWGWGSSNNIIKTYSDPYYAVRSYATISSIEHEYSLNQPNLLVKAYNSFSSSWQNRPVACDRITIKPRSGYVYSYHANLERGTIGSRLGYNNGSIYAEYQGRWILRTQSGDAVWDNVTQGTCHFTNLMPLDRIQVTGMAASGYEVIPIDYYGQRTYSSDPTLSIEVKSTVSIKPPSVVVNWDETGTWSAEGTVTITNPNNQTMHITVDDFWYDADGLEISSAVEIGFAFTSGTDISPNQSYIKDIYVRDMDSNYAPPVNEYILTGTWSCGGKSGDLRY